MRPGPHPYVGNDPARDGTPRRIQLEQTLVVSSRSVKMSVRRFPIPLAIVALGVHRHPPQPLLPT